MGSGKVVIHKVESYRIHVKRKPCAADRRIINLALTKKEKQVLGEAKKMMRDNTRASLSCLKSEELKELAVTLRKLAELVSKIK